MDAHTISKKNRNRLRSEHPVAFDALSSILLQEDPLSINFGINPDEYEIEAEKILPRLYNCHTIGQVQKVIHEEFVRLFGDETTGPHDSYEKIAKRIWRELPSWFQTRTYPLGRSLRISA